MVPEIGRRNSRLDERIRYGHGQKNIRTVIHTSLPDSAEAYIQEAGRGGRDGKNSLAILIDDLARSSVERTQVQEGDGPSSARCPTCGQQVDGQGQDERHSVRSILDGLTHFEGQDSRESHPNGLHPSGLPHCEKSLSNEPRPGGETERSVQNLRSRRFSPYPSLDTCRREFLLHLLGEEETPICGSCDNCLEKIKLSSEPEEVGVASTSTTEWRHLSGAEGFLEALFLCSAHQRQWTKAEFVRMLGPNGRGKGRFTGLLFGWTDEERKELVQALLELHVLSIVGRGPWKIASRWGQRAKYS